MYKYKPRRQRARPVDEVFLCGQCADIAVNPNYCQGCGTLFCESCSPSERTCKCGGQKGKVPISIQVTCKNPQCGSVLPIERLIEHENECTKVKCKNFKYCNSRLVMRRNGFCSLQCEMTDLALKIEDQLQLRKAIKTILNQRQSMIQSGKFEKVGSDLLLSQDGHQILLSSLQYKFRTLLYQFQLKPGNIYYWEILLHEENSHQIMIGISLDPHLERSQPLSINPFGFAYYGIGELKNGLQNSRKYGKKFKKGQTVGVKLDSKAGNLSFFLNGEDLGVAFEEKSLKTKSGWPSVSLFRNTGCRLMNLRQLT